MGTLTEDFESYATGAEPSSGWSLSYGAVTFEVESVGGSKVLRCETGNVSGAYKWDDASPLSGDIVLSGKVFVYSNSSPSIFFHFGSSPTWDGYRFVIRGSANSPQGISLVRYISNSSTTLDSNTSAPWNTLSGYYNFEISVSGGTIEVRMWVVGGSRPATASLSASDSTFTSGDIVFGIYTFLAGAVYYDDLSATWTNVDVDVDPIGALTITGYNPSVSFTNLTDVSPHGRLEVTGYDPLVRASLTPSVGAIAIAGYNPTVDAQQPQTATLWFKFRDGDGVVKSFNIGRRPSVQTIVAPVGDPPESSTDVNDDIVLVDATNNSIAINLPQAGTRTGFIFWIKKIDSSANVVTVTPDGAETIDGGATKVLSSQYEVISLVSDGADWWIIGSG